MPNAFDCDYNILTANDDGIRQGAPRILYIHTFEGRDLDAVAMARYQLSPAAAGSYHIVIDVDGHTARENDDEFIPWAAGYTANRNGHHVSLAGQARFTREQWLNRRAQLDTLSRIVAAYSETYGYPPILRWAGDLVAGKWGVSSHAEASKAWGETDHTDPGVGFPFDVVLADAVRIIAAAKPTPEPPQETPAKMIAPGLKYPSYLDGRELRFSEYIRYIDEKVTRLFDDLFPGGGPAFAVDLDAGSVGSQYPSYADSRATFTLDQYIRLIDYKLDAIVKEKLS